MFAGTLSTAAKEFCFVDFADRTCSIAVCMKRWVLDRVLNNGCRFKLLQHAEQRCISHICYIARIVVLHYSSKAARDASHNTIETVSAGTQAPKTN